MANESARRIVITGATRGLGRALAESFIASGHIVAGCGRNRNSVEEMAARFGPPHRFDEVDVSDAARVDAWSDNTLRGGPVDIVVNNAAIMNPNHPLWKVNAGEFSHLIDVNIKGVFLVIKAFLPALIERGSGVIINLSSGWGRAVSADVAPYCASKWAVEGLTRALALELPDGLAAIPLNPGIINTDLLRTCFGAAAAHYPSPGEWARRAAPFILSLGPTQNGEPLTVPG